MSDNAVTAAGKVSRPLIGGQLSTAGGWCRVLERAITAEAEVVQLFSSNPRMWPVAPPDTQALTEMAAEFDALGVPLFIHAIYLINPASPDESLRQKSVSALSHALLTAALAHARGVVIHLGSHRGQGFESAAGWIVRTLREAWSQAETDLALLTSAACPTGPLELAPLLLETAAGSGATVGGTLVELQALIELLSASASDSPRTGLCLDTAHMFAAGYALHQPDGLEATLAELEQLGLLPLVRLIHLNDSSSLFASRCDRHANPGEGEFTHDGIARVVNHPGFRHLPFVLEVPGFEGHGPGRAEVAAVKAMRLTNPESTGGSDVH